MSTSANHVVIDSRYRTNINDFPHNFNINLQNPITNFTSIDLINVTLPNGYFNVSSSRNNSSIIINGTKYTISDGNYDIFRYTASFQILFPRNIYMLYRPIQNLISISNDLFTNFTIDFSDPSVKGTAYTLGYNIKLYTGLPIYDAQFPVFLSPLAILIDISAISRFVSATNSNIRMATYVIPNSTNQSEYVQFYSNSCYDSTIFTEKNIPNSLNIQLRDTLGEFLHGIGDWIMILRFNR